MSRPGTIRSANPPKRPDATTKRSTFIRAETIARSDEDATKYFDVLRQRSFSASLNQPSVGFQADIKSIEATR